MRSRRRIRVSIRSWTKTKRIVDGRASRALLEHVSQPRRRFVSGQASTHHRFPSYVGFLLKGAAHEGKRRSILFSLELHGSRIDAVSRLSFHSFPSFHEGEIRTRVGGRILADVPISYDERPS